MFGSDRDERSGVVPVGVARLPSHYFLFLATADLGILGICCAVASRLGADAAAVAPGIGISANAKARETLAKPPYWQGGRDDLNHPSLAILAVRTTNAGNAIATATVTNRPARRPQGGNMPMAPRVPTPHRSKTAATDDTVLAERWGALLGGGLLTLFGLTRRSIPGLALAAAGIGLIYRAFLRPRSTGHPVDDDITVRRAITVNYPVEDLFAFWRDFRNLPRFMHHLLSVRVLDERRSHWEAKGPAGSRASWDAEIIDERPNELIVWRSLPDSEVPNDGSVRFAQAAAGRGTEVTVTLAYRPPFGSVGAAFAKLLGEEPDQQVREDLRRFKAMMEAGEVPTVDGQPSGRDE